MEARIKKLNSKSINSSGKYVAYVMEASQRADYNHALEFAIMLSNEYKKPLVVIYNLTDKYKFSNLRYYTFMIEGLIKLRKIFEERRIKFFIRKSDYVNGSIEISKDAAALVTDRNYLKLQRNWREKVANLIDIPLYEIESDVIVPIELVSQKKEPYAATIRPKILKLLNQFLEPVSYKDLKFKSDFIELDSLNFETPNEFISNLQIDKSVKPVSEYYEGGYDNALKFLQIFIEKKLSRYKELRSDPTQDFQSELSPYIHFGQISTLQIILEILKHYDIKDENVQTFINEAVIWRELARNFCFYNQMYNQYEGIPDWAKQTLVEHLKDKREFIYSLKELELAKTHDPYWNAAQIQLLKTGKMHNYMRMYWAKRLIEWTKHPKDAFDYACYLNDKYELDGRDPNGYAGISWCFGTHDRPWFERQIFGKVRYMNDKGLERKFDVKKYVEKFSNL
ncbi:MAG: deoxyribodipyrimidine photo-lyase [Ignavibacteria bacterium]|jgi:deoxyribodipyrimidine photo-lyase|nr:deoxyribodipyrimidine photo-lyase [Ignavibacteria bacterium]MDH7526899.1 deoxyribodipyrimidine photo-lyase [Ignavibacteria bacterium]